MLRITYEDFYERGMEYQNNISISGGDEKNSFAMSYGNTYSDGVIPTKADLFKRNIFSFRGDHKYGKFNASYDISYVRKDIRALSSGQGSDGAALFQELAQMPVDIPLTQLKDYNSMYHNIDNFFTLYAENPYWVVDNNGNTYQDDRVYGKIELGYSVFPILNYLDVWEVILPIYAKEVSMQLQELHPIPGTMVQKQISQELMMSTTVIMDRLTQAD